MQKLLLPIPDACAALSIGRTMAYEQVAEGNLTLVKIGRRSFITAESIAAYVDRLRNASIGAGENAVSEWQRADDARGVPA